MARHVLWGKCILHWNPTSTQVQFGNPGQASIHKTTLQELRMLSRSFLLLQYQMVRRRCWFDTPGKYVSADPSHQLSERPKGHMSLHHHLCSALWRSWNLKWLSYWVNDKVAKNSKGVESEKQSTWDPQYRVQCQVKQITWRKAPFTILKEAHPLWILNLIYHT